MESDCSASARRQKSVFGMYDPDDPSTQKHPNHIESVLEARLTVPINPDCGGVGEVPSFLRAHGANRTAEIGPPSRFDFDKRHGAGSLNDEVDVTVANPKASGHDAPPLPSHPSFGK